MAFDILIDAAELRLHINDKNWAVVDCRFSLDDTGRGRRDYLKAHIPGAVYAHLDEDLSGKKVPGKTGRHPLPEIYSLAETLSVWGIDADTQVVAYDDASGALAAARMWWLLRWLGHQAVAILDGGWQVWVKENRPVANGKEQRPRRNFIAQPRNELVIDAAFVSANLDNPAFQLADARSAERYRGENETIDPIAGHIPGAASAPNQDNLDSDGKFLSKDALRRHYLRVVGGNKGAVVAFYCGSGVSACLDILAYEYAGLGEVRLYPGSWSEWITDPNRPVATGADK